MSVASTSTFDWSRNDVSTFVIRRLGARFFEWNQKRLWCVRLCDTFNGRFTWKPQRGDHSILLETSTQVAFQLGPDRCCDTLYKFVNCFRGCNRYRNFRFWFQFLEIAFYLSLLFWLFGSAFTLTFLVKQHARNAITTTRSISKTHWFVSQEIDSVVQRVIWMDNR